MKMILANCRVCMARNLVAVALWIFITTIFCNYKIVLENPTKPVSNLLLTNSPVDQLFLCCSLPPMRGLSVNQPCVQLTWSKGRCEGCFPLQSSGLKPLSAVEQTIVTVKHDQICILFVFHYPMYFTITQLTHISLLCHERTPRESGRAAREIEEVESGW